ncbi:MAG TPA: hypothetical protein VMF11_12070 [Candidatus Baltobacteraceae bacterium]|nr:hypothetical protein [Candidatus Baltobacteraceae bacterium]
MRELKRNDAIDRGELSAPEAHQRAMSLPIEEAVGELISLLGAKTVATIGGVGETRAVAQWTTGRLPQRSNVLRFALQIAAMIGSANDPEAVRAWFHGSNPHLADRVPALMLRDEPLHEIQGEIMTAARAFAAR